MFYLHADLLRCRSTMLMMFLCLSRQMEGMKLHELASSARLDQKQFTATIERGCKQPLSAI